MYIDWLEHTQPENIECENTGLKPEFDYPNF